MLVEVTDLIGKVIHSETSKNHSLQMNISELDRGMYIVNVIANEYTSSSKFVKQ
jgi:hypothetical protein